MFSQSIGQPVSTTSAPDDSLRLTLKVLVSALMLRDAETYRHSRRVLRVGLLLGCECKLDRAQTRALAHGALLHDVGKIGVPDSILHKPGRLTDAEWGLMREHSRAGAQFLRSLGFCREATRVVAEHHEKWDGSGYPAGLRGEQIDLKSRILAVADAFDAMIHDRAYRAGRTIRAAIEELDRCAGTHFDPSVVKAFHRIPSEGWVI